MLCFDILQGSDFPNFLIYRSQMFYEGRRLLRGNEVKRDLFSLPQKHKQFSRSTFMHYKSLHLKLEELLRER
nr:MAG TPA: hypothetical protein [Caudoviricetes sp.]